MASDIRPPNPNRVREKVILKPGFHLVDWMRVMKAMSDISPGAAHRRISHAELAEHKSQFDCWTAYKGKVYNISQYLPYHPGGVPKLMLGAGQDCTQLFERYHPWVNCASMLSKCFIGVLAVDDEIPETIQEGNEMQSEQSSTKSIEVLPSIPPSASINVTGSRVTSMVISSDDTSTNSNMNALPVVPNKVSGGSIPVDSTGTGINTSSITRERPQRRDILRLLELCDDESIGYNPYDVYGISVVPRVQLPVLASSTQQVAEARGDARDGGGEELQHPAKYMRTNYGNDNNRLDGNATEVFIEGMKNLIV